MQKDFFDDLARRDERVRSKTFNNKEYTVRCTDPYGHWHIDIKNPPNELLGSFTSAELAWNKIQAYEDREALKKQSAQPTPSAPTQVKTLKKEM